MYNADKIDAMYETIQTELMRFKKECDKLASLPDADEAYKKGLDEAWELARKIASHEDHGGYSTTELVEIFGCPSSRIIFEDNICTEALAKLRDYEARKKAEVEAATFKREILFRGKRIDTGEWVFGSLCNRSVRHPYIEAFEWEGENHPVPVAYDVEPASVGQFTGLEDANGTRIFEGDMFDDYNVVTFCNGGFCVNGDSDISLWLKQTVKGNEYDKKHGPF